MQCAAVFWRVTFFASKPQTSSYLLMSYITGATCCGVQLEIAEDDGEVFKTLIEKSLNMIECDLR